ncbi:ankyrin repeat domain-containing protein 34A-like [Mytilus trossulus]|uniref:ankyrin repeat domain-containing protein 34A-like n=1 Tax=Mytilus trossulus TaxID=6551 RepID=UPI003005D545
MSAKNCLKSMVKRWKKKALATKCGLNDDEQLVFKAISEGKFRLARILIERNVNVNCTDNDDRTPLITVCRLKNIQIKEKDRLRFVKFLLNQEGTVLNSTDVFGKQALDYASENKLQPVVTVIADTIENIFDNVLFGF